MDKLGRLEEAISDFSRAISLDGDNASSHNSRGLARDRAAGMKQDAAAAAALREAAILDFSAAVQLEPGNPVFRHNRGFCFRCVPRPRACRAVGSCSNAPQRGTLRSPPQPPNPSPLSPSQ